MAGGAIHGGLTQAHTVNNYYAAPPPPVEGAGDAPHDWAREVAGSPLWERVPEGRDRDPVRAAACDIASALAALHDEDARELADDPWWDQAFAVRFHGRVSQLVPATAAAAWDFHPVEVALLTLTPFLSQTLWVRTAARRLDVRPTDLRLTEAKEDRGAFEKFFDDGHERLARRASYGRPGAKSDIGWWLFHQWLDQDTRVRRAQGGAYKDLVAQLPLRGDYLKDLFGRAVIGRLIQGLRSPLWEACDRLGQFEDDFTVGGWLHDPQKVRVRRLALLLGAARACALDLPALPEDLVENLGIPERVDLRELRETTVHRAVWNDDHGPLVLVADCRHEAAVEALRRHVAHVDELLGDIHRATWNVETLQPLRTLPQRASAERVKPARREDGQPEFGSYGKFHVDPRRVQNLLMGDQLYRSPGLAIRELYQNALDACRYRKARTDFLALRGGTAPDDWKGEIVFEQGVAEDGRPYLECRDNGIGMGEAELMRVFARAGTRFTDLTDVRNERSEWEDAGIRMYPVSRFGIGVLSYFMIADEIEVVTRKLAANLDWTEPCFQVAIYGPNHLFRIRECRGRKEPGTTIRLYLRDNAPSCVTELTRLLGVAEFDTRAEHGARSESWPAGVYRSHEEGHHDRAIEAYGPLVPGPQAEGADVPSVVWCNSGGAVLVDGILTTPVVRRAALATTWAERRMHSYTGRGKTLRGAVVNLTGERVPKLSVDRLQILGDVAPDVADLLGAAVGHLVASDSELLDFSWIAHVAETHLKVADIIVEGVMAADRELRLPDGRTFRPAVVGCLPQDADFLGWVRSRERLSRPVPDAVLLWRLLAHGEAGPLMELVPELGEPNRLLPARPSDVAVWEAYDEPWDRPGYVLATAADVGLSAREFAKRAGELVAADIEPDRYPVDTPDPNDLAVLSRDLDGHGPWLSRTDPVPLRHFLRAHVKLDLAISQIAERLARYGFVVSAADTLPDRPAGTELRLLLGPGQGDGAWPQGDTEVPPGHVLWVAEDTGLSVSEVCHRLRERGLTVVEPPERHGAHDTKLLTETLDTTSPHWFRLGDEVSFDHIKQASKTCRMSVDDVIAVLGTYGLQLVKPRRTELTPLDRELLGFATSTDFEHGWILPDNVQFSDVMEVAEATGLSWAATADRLRELGVVCPLVFPEELSAEDAAALNVNLDLWRSRNTRQVDVTTVDLLITARRLRMPVGDTLALLESYGLRGPDHELPDIDDLHSALVLLSRDLDGRSPWIFPDTPVPLSHIVAASKTLGITVLQVADRLRGLGIDVPDVAETVRAAVARLPRSAG